MVLAAIALVLVVVVVGAALLARRRRGAAAPRPSDPPADDDTGPALSRKAPRHDTALDELRAMRDALKPAEHSRVERRRPAGGGSRSGPERRRARAALAGSRALPGASANAGGGDESEVQDRA